MEKNFYQDNFEQLLRDTTDNFRMYPSKRVWHSIYNDLHPSRKWPSLAIWLLLISSVTYIGISNRIPVKPNENNLPVAAVITAKNGTITPGSNNPTMVSNNSKPVNRQEIVNNFSNTASKIDTRNNPMNNKGTEQVSQASKLLAFYNDKSNNTNDVTSDVATWAVGSIKNNEEPSGKTTGISLTEDYQTTKDKISTVADLSETVAAKKKDHSTVTGNDIKNEKAWIEDYAFHNKPSSSKWKSKSSYQFYTTASIGYRRMTKNTAYQPVVARSLIINSPVEENFESAVSHVPAVNMELGGNLLYSFSSRLNLKIGVQLNYSNYNINAYELKHPTMTNLMLNDINTNLPVLSPRSTTLANTDGLYSTKLNNNSYQVSLPIGADFKLAGNENLKWFAGATIQPTYIAGGNSYLISSDLKNYVTDNSLVRKWNVNAGIETFISYKTKSGIILNAGPQLRYQLLSTYSKIYTYDEKMYNIGLKIGITTRF